MKNIKLQKLLAIAGALLIGMMLFGSALAQTKTVDGVWDASMNTPGGVINNKVTFKTDGEKLTGTVKRQSGEVPLTGTVKGNDITFSYTVNYNGNDLTLTITGKIDGDTIKGSIDFAGQASDEWSAKRAPAA